MAGNADDEDRLRKNQKPLDPSNFIADDEENRDSDIRSSSDGNDGISRGDLEKPLDHKKGPPNLGIDTSTSNSGKIASEVGGISSTSSARHVVGSDTFTSSSGNIGGISLTRSAGLAIGSSTLTSSSGNIASEAQGNSLKRSAELAYGSDTLTSSLGNIRDEDHCHKNQKIGGSSGRETDWKKPLDPLYFNTEDGEHGELDIQSRPDGNDGTNLRNLEKPLDHKKGPPNFGIDTSTSNSGKSSSEVGGISSTRSGRHTIGSDTSTSSSVNVGGISLTELEIRAIGSLNQLKGLKSRSRNIEGISLTRSAGLASGSGTSGQPPQSSQGESGDSDEDEK